MKIDDFKKHTINRSNPSHKSNYQQYKSILKQDFCGRCAYCNISDESITTPFEIDHFVPKSAFNGIRPELLTDYNNLIYACKKCNVAKSNQFSGKITSTHPSNDLFYDPVKVDYNTIFYRNEFGAIDSDDELGKQMINRLKLYRPIHILGWLCEKIYETSNRLNAAIEKENDPQKIEKLRSALSSINKQYIHYSRMFIASYNDSDFSLQ